MLWRKRWFAVGVVWLFLLRREAIVGCGPVNCNGIDRFPAFITAGSGFLFILNLVSRGGTRIRGNSGILDSIGQR